MLTQYLGWAGLFLSLALFLAGQWRLSHIRSNRDLVTGLVLGLLGLAGSIGVTIAADLP